jgi:cysteine-rich repeat protein
MHVSTVLVLAGACSGDERASGGYGGSGAAWDGGGAGGSGAAATGGSNVDASRSCGNSIVEPGEACDDGNDSDEDTCLSDCTLACGDGIVNAVETCDTGIAAGAPGACPSQCNSEGCTIRTLRGEECTAACQETLITASVDGDGCCPSGASSLNDTDCLPACGNGALELGERCDTGIAAGSAGACVTPASCDDLDPCTVNAVAGAGTCAAMCDNPPVTPDLQQADGCCPSGATYLTDADCDPNCGNGVVDTNETCDTAIPQGNDGACPTSCASDGDACTNDRLVTANPCSPTCVYPRKTAMADGDGCCDPALGATSLLDSDCTPTAFRIVKMDLRDPHLFTEGTPCVDQTEAVNAGLINASIGGDTSGSDAGADGYFDLSFLVVFDPLNQAGAGGTLEFVQAECPVPGSPDAGPTGGDCTRIPGTSQFLPYTNIAYDPDSPNSSTVCVAPVPGSVRPYDPPVVSPTVGTSGCFGSQAANLSLALGPVTFQFAGARIGAQWSGDPATGLVDGLILGFLTEEEVDAIVIPFGGGVPFGVLLPGADGASCTDPAYVDKDLYDVNGDGTAESGWWVYLQYEAQVVPLGL